MELMLKEVENKVKETIDYIKLIAKNNKEQENKFDELLSSEWFNKFVKDINDF